MKTEVSTNQNFNREAAFSYTSDPRLFGLRRKSMIDISQKETIRSIFMPATGQRAPFYNDAGSQSVRFQIDLGTSPDFVLDTEASCLQITVEIGRRAIANTSGAATAPLTVNDATGTYDCLPWMLPLLLIQDIVVNTSDATTPIHAFNQNPYAYMSALQYLLMTQWDRWAASANQFLLINSDGSMIEEKLDNNYMLSEVSKKRSHEFCAGATTGVYHTFSIPLSLLAPAFGRGYFTANVRRLWLTMLLRASSDPLWARFSTDPQVGGSNAGVQTHIINVNVVDMQFQAQQVRLAAVAEGSNTASQRTNEPENYTWLDPWTLRLPWTGSTLQIPPVNNFIEIMYGFRAIDVLGPDKLAESNVNVTTAAGATALIAAGNAFCFNNCMQFLPPQSMTVANRDTLIYGDAATYAQVKTREGFCINIGTWVSSTNISVGSSTYPQQRLLIKYPNIYNGDANNTIINAGRQSHTRGSLAEAYMLYKIACNWHGKRLGTPLISPAAFESCYSFFLISSKDLLCLSESAPNQRITIEYQQGTSSPISNSRFLNNSNMTIVLVTLGAAQVFPDSSCAIIRQAY